MSPDDWSDEALLRALRGVLRPRTEPPAAVLAAARELFGLRDLEAELAALTYDSLLDDAPVGIRAAAQPRILTFTAENLTIEVEIDAGPTGRRLLGQLVPAQAAELELRWDNEKIAATADELGRFTLGAPANRQRVTLRVSLRDGEAVDTAPIVV